MSSYSEQQPPSSSQFVPPQSAQPIRSLFGAPSSDAAPLSSSQPEPARRSIFGAPSQQDDAPESASGSGPGDWGPLEVEGDEVDDFDMIMRERPLQADYDDGSESYDDSETDDPLPEPVTGEEVKLRRKSQSPVRPVAAPTTYVLDRGLDLPPGVERPNRWTGNATTYRRITAPDRGAFDGMVTARARDLAAHLYNTFVIRSQKKPSQSLDSLGAEENDGPERLAVPKRWVAWPLSASRVPRPDETARRILDDPDTLRAPPELRPSAELEESIIAYMMKDAKETFRARDTADHDVTSGHPRKPEISDIATDDEDKAGAGAINETSRIPPVFQADDDKTRRQLRPLARNVISQLSRVLTGLHHSTYGRSGDDDLNGEPVSDTDDNVSRSPRKEGNRSRSRGRRRSRLRSRRESTSGGRSRSEHSSTGPETEEETMGDESQSRGRPRASRAHDDEFDSSDQCRKRLVLRDWSEIMGLASMVGLPASAVMRASNRCAGLFGQDMTFRTFREGRIEKAARLPDSTYEYRYIESESAESEREPTPPPRRKRKARPGERSPSQGRRSRSRITPTPRPADPSPADEAVVVSAAPGPGESTTHENTSPPAQREPAQRPKGKGEHRKADLVCPLRLCPRHTKGFSRVWNLNLHMKRVHPGYNPQEGERSRSRSQSVPGQGAGIVKIE